jgi:four helix bundle protein
MQNAERQYNMSGNDLRERTKAFALRAIKLANSLPMGKLGDVLGRQVLKSGTSIGANWREACRASSKRHFVTTAEICLREADETLYWLELLSESNVVKPARLVPMKDECNQLVAIFATTGNRAKQSLHRKSEK